MPQHYNAKKVVLHGTQIPIAFENIAEQPPIPEGHRLVAIINDQGWISAWDATERTVEYERMVQAVRVMMFKTVDFYMIPPEHVEECKTQKGDMPVSLAELTQFITSAEFRNNAADPKNN